MNSKTEYIATQNCFKTYSLYSEHPEIFKPLDKFPIHEIKFDKIYLDYANSVRKEDVDNIVNNFSLDAWEPIFINPLYFLTDGQHRLAAARKMKLKYIDVILIDDNKLKHKE